MAIHCPDCHAHAQFVAEMDLPPDDAWEEIEFDLYECHCGFHGLTVGCEKHRGETADHYGRRLSAAHARTIVALIQDCPDPSDRRCRCEAHLSFGRQEGGKWCGLERWGAEKSFRIERVRS